MVTKRCVGWFPSTRETLARVTLCSPEGDCMLQCFQSRRCGTDGPASPRSPLTTLASILLFVGKEGGREGDGTYRCEGEDGRSDGVRVRLARVSMRRQNTCRNNERVKCEKLPRQNAGKKGDSIQTEGNSQCGREQ